MFCLSVLSPSHDAAIMGLRAAAVERRRHTRGACVRAHLSVPSTTLDMTALRCIVFGTIARAFRLLTPTLTCLIFRRCRGAFPIAASEK